MRRILLIASMTLLIVAIGSGQGIGLKGIGGGVGFTSVSFASGTSTESLSGLSLSGQAYLGDVAQNLGLYPEIVYWSASKDFGSGVDWSVGDFAINANAHYAFDTQGSVKPYVGAGLGLNFLSSTTKMNLPFFGTTEVSGSATRLGINILGGAQYALNSNLSVIADARYVIASDFNHFMIRAGVMYALK